MPSGILTSPILFFYHRCGFPSQFSSVFTSFGVFLFKNVAVGDTMYIFH